MSEINPNTPVQTEGTVQSRANSAVSFSDIEAIDDEISGKPASKAKPTGGVKKSAVKSPVDVSADDDDSGDEPSEAVEQKDETGSKAKEKTDKAAKPTKESEDTPEKAKPEQAAKPRTFKFKNGEENVAISSNAVVGVKVAGRDEEVKLEDLVNEYSGKTNWTRKYQELDKDKMMFHEERNGLNDRIETLFKKSSENPELAWDYLCELSGKDPVEVKEGLIRSMIKEILPLARMDEGEIETWIGDRKRDWRDAKHAHREESVKQQAQQAQVQQSRRQVQEQYAIAGEEFEQAEANANAWLKAQGANERATPEQIAYVHRAEMAKDVVHQICPHLAQRDDFSKIMGEITSDLVKNPGMTKEKLGAMLDKVFNDGQAGNEGAKRIARKVQRATDLEGDQSLTSPRPSKNKSDATFFSDI